jgi:two-component system, OmpR family, heavy metal sensor histidine kinase CusS
MKGAVLKIQSFRLRIAVLAAVLAGTALVGFGALSSWLIYEAKVSRLDAELESQLMRAGRPRLHERWQSYEAALPQAFGISAKTPIALLVLDPEGRQIYRSPQWSTVLNPAPLWTIPERRGFVPGPPLAPPLLPLEPRTGGAQTDRDRLTDERAIAAPNFPDRPPPVPQWMTQRTATETWRIGAVTTPFSRVAIAVSLTAIDQEMAVIQNIFLVAIPGVLLLVAGGAWLIAGSSLHPIHRLTQVISTVTASGLEKRVPIGATDVEFVELIQVFNQMLERIEQSFKQASRFSADAAHELKTPLAILQGELERTLQQADPGSEVQQGLSRLLDEVQRLGSIVRKLLLLSLADAGRMGLHRVGVDLSHLLAELLDDIELLAPQLDVQAEIAAGLQVAGDRDLLIQVLQNLLSNAIKYNLPQGWIRIVARRQGDRVVITMRNSSAEILGSDRDRIFDRFYRGDPARTRKVEGLGLGLSLAREISQAHRGTLGLDSTPLGETAFTLRLPVGP